MAVAAVYGRRQVQEKPALIERRYRKVVATVDGLATAGSSKTWWKSRRAGKRALRYRSRNESVMARKRVQPGTESAARKRSGDFTPPASGINPLLQKPRRRRKAAGEAAGAGLHAGAVRLLDYQRRWVEDDSPLKIVVKARQIGYSFSATLRALLRCLDRKTTWIFLSKGERQSRLLMEKVHEHIHSCGIIADVYESTFFEGASLKQLEVRFPNGSVIYGLPSNPDTARGGAALAGITARRIFSRFSGIDSVTDQPAGGAMVLTVTAQYMTLTVEVGDLVYLSHPLAPNLRTGRRGIYNEIFEVIDKQPDYSKATMTYKLLDMSWLSSKPLSLIAPAGTSAWTLATGSERNRYMFLSSSATGEYSDGTSGKTVW